MIHRHWHPGWCRFRSNRFLAPGDVVEVTIEGIGQVRNPVRQRLSEHKTLPNVFADAR